MRMLYVRLSTRLFGMSLSALAWKRAQGGRPWCRNRIDGFWLLFFGIHNHTQSSFQRERGDRDQSSDID